MEEQQGSGKFNVPWSDLPKELAERIGDCLDNRIDVLHFRSVCTTWRSSLAPFKKNIPPLPFEIPFPLDDDDTHRSHGYHLIESTVCVFQPLDGSSKGWLIKVIKTADGKSRVLNPLTGRVIQVLPNHMPKVLNLLDFRVSQVCKSYHVQHFNSLRDYEIGCVRKILLLNNYNAGSESNKFSLMAIDRYGLLCYLKSGDEKWNKLKNATSYSDDIIVYKGNFYAVDRYGETVKFDSSFNEMMVASGISDGDRKKKRLVESGGQLFLIDSSSDFGKNANHEIKMYRLDEEQNEWIEVHTLGDDRIFFAVNDCCFSVSSRDFGDQYCRGNCIYYVNGPVYYDDEDSDDDMGCGCCCGFSDDDSVGVYVEGYDEFDYPISKDINGSGSKSVGVREEKVVNRYEGVFDNNTCVFNIEDGKLGSLLSSLDYAEILWPPPSWLNGVDQPPSPVHEIAETNKDEVTS